MIKVSEILAAIKPYVIGWINKSDTWVPTFTGFSANPAGAICRYVLVGKLCTLMVYMPNAGTSDATGFTMTLPFTAATVTGMWWFAPIARVVDNGTIGTTPGLVAIQSAGTTMALYTNSAGAAWTNSGTKRAVFSITYEVA